jgi:hypothetical protein
MTATSNPQAAAEQAHKDYRDVTTQLGQLGLDTAVPEAVRAMELRSPWLRPANSMIAPRMSSTHRSRHLRRPSTLLAKVLRRSTAKSSISHSGM